MTQTEAPIDGVDAPIVDSPVSGTNRVRSWGSHGLDVVAVVALAALLLYLAGRDGGVGMTSWHLGWVIALTLPPAVRELQRVPTVVQAVVAAWALGAVVALLFAVDRSGFVRVTLVYALMPMAALTTMRLLRRPWGRLAIVALLVGAFGLYWQRSFMQWWGYTLGDLDTRWLPLSWHNQAATLMGAFGVFFFAIAATTKRVVSPAAGLLAAMGLAGVWLAGSRGAVVAVILGLIVAVWIGIRWQGWRRAAVVTAAVVAGTVLITGGLLAMDNEPERVTSDESATTNLLARLDHMQAAGGMFASRPLTGYGLGSYGSSARAHSSPETRLTISPHNEFLEPFAEGGLAFGSAVLAGGVLVGLAALKVMTTPAPLAARHSEVRSKLETATVAAAAATTVVLLSHALVDFDWRYPVLAALIAVVAPMAWRPLRSSTTPPRTRTGSVLGIVGALALVALLTTGLAGAWSERPTRESPEEVSALEFARANPGWDATSNARVATSLLRGGDPEEAQLALVRARTWNPGVSELGGLQRIAEVQQGRRDPEALLDTFEPRPTRFGLRNLAAELLIDRGELDIAEQLLDESLALNHAHRAWGVKRPVVRSWELHIEIQARRNNCVGADGIAAALERDPVLGGDDAARRHLREYGADRCRGESS